MIHFKFGDMFVEKIELERDERISKDVTEDTLLYLAFTIGVLLEMKSVG